jgi:hypothetical protein
MPVNYRNTLLTLDINQEELEKDKPGATILPIIISTDKTQLTTF